VLALAGCGDDAATTPPPEPEVDPVVLVSGPAGGGDSATESTDVTGEDALASYLEQFEQSLAAKVSVAAAKVDVGDGERLVAQVVSVGCDVPPGATVRGDEIVPDKVDSPLKECFAPVTTVALAAVPG